MKLGEEAEVSVKSVFSLPCLSTGPINRVSTCFCFHFFTAHSGLSSPRSGLCLWHSAKTSASRIPVIFVHQIQWPFFQLPLLKLSAKLDTWATSLWLKSKISSAYSTSSATKKGKILLSVLCVCVCVWVGFFVFFLVCFLGVFWVVCVFCFSPFIQCIPGSPCPWSKSEQGDRSFIWSEGQSLYNSLLLCCCSHTFRETNSLRRAMQIVECSLLQRRAQGRVSS